MAGLPFVLAARAQKAEHVVFWPAPCLGCGTSVGAPVANGVLGDSERVCCWASRDPFFVYFTLYFRQTLIWSLALDGGGGRESRALLRSVVCKFVSLLGVRRDLCCWKI